MLHCLMEYDASCLCAIQLLWFYSYTENILFITVLSLVSSFCQELTAKMSSKDEYFGTFYVKVE